MARSARRALSATSTSKSPPAQCGGDELTNAGRVVDDEHPAPRSRPLLLATGQLAQVVGVDDHHHFATPEKGGAGDVARALEDGAERLDRHPSPAEDLADGDRHLARTGRENHEVGRRALRLLAHGVGQREHRQILGLEAGPANPVLIDRDLGEGGHDRSLDRRFGQAPEVVPVGHHDDVLKDQGDREGQGDGGAGAGVRFELDSAVHPFEDLGHGGQAVTGPGEVVGSVDGRETRKRKGAKTRSDPSTGIPR